MTTMDEYTRQLLYSLGFYPKKRRTYLELYQDLYRRQRLHEAYIRALWDRFRIKPVRGGVLFKFRFKI